MNNYFNIFFIMCSIVGIICLIRILICKYENSMIFQPDQISELDANKIIGTNNHDNRISNQRIKTIDGEVLDCLFYKNEEYPDKLLLYFHGNAGNIYDDIELLPKLGKKNSVLIWDYRGYGLSTGTPTEADIHTDILAVWFYVTEQLNYKPQNIVFYGRSLGCSFALWLGKKIIKSGGELPKSIIIESGFYNLKDIANEMIIFSGYLTNSKLDNISYIQKINKHIPLLFIHSQDDEIIGIHHALKLLQDSGYERNSLVVINGGHNNIVRGEEYFRRVESFIG